MLMLSDSQWWNVWVPRYVPAYIYLCTDHIVLRTSIPYTRFCSWGWCPKERGRKRCGLHSAFMPHLALPSLTVFFLTTYPSPTKAFPDIRGQQPLSPGLSDSSGIYCAGVLSIFLPIPFSSNIALRGPYPDTRVSERVLLTSPRHNALPCFLSPLSRYGRWTVPYCPVPYYSCNCFSFASTVCVGRGEPQEVTQTLKRAFASARVLVLVPLSSR